MEPQSFIAFATVVLDLRKEDGVRGHLKELNRFRNHIATAPFAGLQLEDVRSPHIREWLREMQRKPAKDRRGERSLSTRTIARCLSLVSAVFEAAVERELIETNPCRGVKLKKRADERETKEKWTFLTLAEQKAIASCVGIPHEDRVAIRFAVGTGLRQGEQFNLEMRDVHIDGEHPHVFVRFGSKGLPPKSGKTRRVPLFGDGLAAAREALELASKGRNPEGLLFPTATGSRRGVGKPLGRVAVLVGSQRRWVDAWKRALVVAGITRNVTWHSLRHTCATNLVTGVLGRRWTLEEIQPLMGHSAIAVTQIYAHLGEDALKTAAKETATTAEVLSKGPEQVRRYAWRHGLIRKVRDRARRAVAAVVGVLRVA